MFDISLRSAYALQAMVYLGEVVMQGRDQEAVMARDIAAANDIPIHYLEQILVSLRRGGVVRSFRGISGGYALARSPQEIKLREILMALEGELRVMKAARGNVGIGFVWREIEQNIDTILEQDLDAIIFRKRNEQNMLTYTI